MNVNEISYMYNSALNGLSVEGTKSVNYEKQIDAAKEALKKAGASGFSSSLNEEVSKLTDEERTRAIEFRELAGALDHSVLGNMVEGATDKDLALMSEEMLGSSKGREVLSKLMEGHFNSMVLGNNDKDEDEEEIDSSLNTDKYLRGTYEG
ncbi:MAG: hypothetical protein IJ195_03145 [Lachnospiraceae bacterium]|nr:hypothetical protein [Lachnospiraceae bacterium]